MVIIIYSIKSKSLAVPVTQRDRGHSRVPHSWTIKLEGNDANAPSHPKYETSQKNTQFHFYHLLSHLAHGTCSVRVPFQPSHAIYKKKHPAYDCLKSFPNTNRSSSTFLSNAMVLLPFQRFSSFPACCGPAADL